MEAAPPAEGTPSEGEVMGCPSDRESMFGMVSRHRREVLELQNKELDLKKAAARGSKAEQKAKKKQVEDEIVELQSRLKSKHSEELASIGYIDTPGKYKGNLNNLVMALAGVSVTGPSESSKPSKGAKRRGRRAQQEAAREQRIQEEQGDIISDRMLEDEKLEEKLEPLGLAVYEIRPDGHCLYRAVEHQLSLDSGTAVRYSYLELRKMAADYMRENSADFHPFFQAEEGTNGSPSESFKQYCDEVESTAAWGGQLELGALTHCLKRHILIYSGSFPDVEMGREYKSEERSGRSDRSIMLSYHVHAYGLGEHYNSVVPNLSS